MQVTVKLGEPLWRAIGHRELTIKLGDGPQTVGDALAALFRTNPALAEEMRPHDDGFVPYSVFLDGQQVRGGETVETLLSEGAELRVCMAIAGG